MRRRVRIISMLLICVLGIAACQRGTQEQVSIADINEESVIEEQEDDNNIFVHVCGAVVQEGVYELSKGSRTYEAIQCAGGFAQDAAVDYINQAEVLEDETRLYIPTLEEVELEQMNGDGKVNLNTATMEELTTLPGVGESKASLIVQYREEHGGFQCIEDVMNISGIKEGLFQKIKEYIKV